MKKYFYLLPFTVLFSCGSTEQNNENTGQTGTENTDNSTEIVTNQKDYFSFEIQLPDGTTLSKVKEFESDRSVACFNRLNEDPNPCILIGFPYGQNNFTLSLTASKPGTYDLPKTETCKSELVIQHFGVANGKSEVKEFRAKALNVTLETIKNRDVKGAKSLIGQSGDGYSSVEGSFSGKMTYTLNGTEMEDCTVSGKFRSFDEK